MNTNIAFMPDDEKFVDELVASGKFESRSDVVLAALQLLRERQWVRERKLLELRKAIQEGLEGPFGPLNMETIIAEAKRRKATSEGGSGSTG